jgi:hypothetical protein
MSVTGYETDPRTPIRNYFANKRVLDAIEIEERDKFELISAVDNLQNLTTDDFAFNNMTEIADATDVAIFGEGECDEECKKSKSQAMHIALDAAGVSPFPIGPAADVINAAMYVSEGAYKDAGFSIGAAITPALISGTIKTIKGANKVFDVAVEHGDELVKIHRGVKDMGPMDIYSMFKGTRITGNWSRGNGKDFFHNPKIIKHWETGIDMVQFDGLLTSRGPVMTTLPANINWIDLLFATPMKEVGYKYGGLYSGGKGIVLEFTMPKSFLVANARTASGITFAEAGFDYLSPRHLEHMRMTYPSLVFTDGIPAMFLTGVEDVSRIAIKDAPVLDINKWFDQFGNWKEVPFGVPGPSGRQFTEWKILGPDGKPLNP